MKKMFKKALALIITLVLLFATVSSAVLTIDVQAANNVPADAVEFNGHYYKIYTNVCESWDEAQIYCEAMNGHLATISNAEENAFLFNYSRQMGHNSVYFGYSDCMTEGSWFWVDGTNTSYTNWHSGEPNKQNNGEDYAMFYYQFNDGTWNDGDFNYGEKSFLCEWDGPCLNGHTWIVEDDLHIECEKCQKRHFFEFGKDNFSFTNKEHGTSKVSLKGNMYSLNAFYGADIVSFITQVTSLFKYKGACFGLAMMNAAFHCGLSTTDFGAETVYGLTNNDKLSDAINLMYFSQGSLLSFIDNNATVEKNLNANLEKVVNIAKNVSEGDFLPVLTFTVDYGTHAVNIIGLTDAGDCYAVLINDSNNIDYPSILMVKKDFSDAEFRVLELNDKGEPIYKHMGDSDKIDYNGKIISINSIITDENYNIDSVAPGLRNDIFNLYGDIGIQSTEMTEEELIAYETEYRENNLLFIVANNATGKFTSASGKYVELENGKVTSTNYAEIRYDELVGLDLVKVIVKKDGDTFTYKSNGETFFYVNNNGAIGSINADKSGTIDYSPSGELIFTPDGETEYKMSFYKDGILPESNVMAARMFGTTSTPINLNCEHGLRFAGDEVADQILQLECCDPEFTTSDFECDGFESGFLVEVGESETGIIFKPIATVSIVNNPGTKTIKYGETLKLTANYKNKPDGAVVCWYVDGVMQSTGDTFELTFESGTKTVEVKLTDSEGNPYTDVAGDDIVDSEKVTVNDGFFQKLISFFKNLFGMDRTVVQ